VEQHTWDKGSLSNEFSTKGSIFDLIQVIEDKFWLQKKVICEIYINGEKLTEEEENEYFAEDAIVVENLRVSTSSVNSLIKNNIISLGKWLRVEVQKTEELIASVEDGRLSEVKDELILVIDGMSFLTTNLSLLKGFLACEVFFETHIKVWEQTEQSFKTIVEDITQGLENHDFALVAEVIDYNYIENLNKWLELLEILEDNYM